MTRFKIKKGIDVVCKSENTRYGFRHLATLVVNGQYVDTATRSYQNRTWEAFEFQSVLYGLLDNSNYVTQRQKKAFFNKISGESKVKIEKEFKTVSMVASLGDLFCDTKKEKNDWKLKMLKAGLESKGLSIPSDWNDLSETEKEKRLDSVIKIGNEK